MFINVALEIEIYVLKLSPSRSYSLHLNLNIKFNRFEDKCISMQYVYDALGQFLSQKK